MHSSLHNISLLSRSLSFCSGWSLTNAHRFAIYAIYTVFKDLWRKSSYPVSHGGRYEASLCTLQSPQSPHSSRKSLLGFIALEDVILWWGASDHSPYTAALLPYGESYMLSILLAKHELPFYVLVPLLINLACCTCTFSM